MTDIIIRLHAWQPSASSSDRIDLMRSAASEIEHLRARILELEAAHEDASGAILQAVAVERNRCARIVREAASVHGLCCSDGEALADLIAGLSP